MWSTAPRVGPTWFSERSAWRSSFERLRGYKQAIRAGKPFRRQLQAFEALVSNCIVLPFDQDAADVAATIWSSSSRRQRQNLGDILIAAIAVARRIVLATRNTRDFKALRDASGIELKLVDWVTAKTRSRTDRCPQCR